MIAEAIVLDGTRGTLQEDTVTVAARLANEIRALPGSATMPNGIRWCKVPIAIVVDNEDIRARTRGDPALRTVVIVSAYAGWDAVYKAVAVTVRDFGMTLVEEYRAAGWQIESDRGRYIRVGVPRPRRRTRSVERIETDLYDGPRDRLYRARTLRERLPLALIFTDETAVEHDVDELRRRMGEIHPEAAYQRFIDRRSYLLGSAPYEVVRQPRLRDPESGEERYPDYGLARVRLSPFDPLPRLVDLKVPQSPLLVNARKYVKFGGEITTGIAQLRGYARDLQDPRAAEHLRGIFNGAAAFGPGLLIAGNRTNVDADALERERELYRDYVELQTYDEMLELAERRFLADQRDDNGPYGLRRIGQLDEEGFA